MPKADSTLLKLLVRLLLLCCVVFSAKVLWAQTDSEVFHESEFFKKLYLVNFDPSEGTSNELNSLITELKLLSIPKEANAKIIKRLLTEADQSADSNLPKAETYWKVAELIAIQNNDYLSLANTIYYRANTLAALDKNREALSEYRRAVKVFGDKPETSDREKFLICEILVAAGETAAYIDENETARDFFEKSWSMLVSINDWRKSETLVRIARAVLLGLGDNARQSGDYSSAKAKFTEALSLTESDNFRRAEVFWELGKLKRDAGDFAAGAADFSEAIKLLGETPASASGTDEQLNLRANLHNSLGLLMLEQRFSKGAEQNLNQALTFARSLKDLRLEGTILKNLSIAARQRKEYQTSKTRALAAFEIAARTDFNDLSISANNIIASLAQASGDYQEAVERLQKSVALAEKDRNILRSVESKWRLGESLFLLQRYSEAKNLAQESLATAQKNRWGNLVYLSATLLGRVLAKEGNFSVAEEMFELAIREIEEKRRSVAGADIEKVSFMQDKATAYHELLKLRVRESKSEEAFAVAEKIKSRVLEDKVGGRIKVDPKMNPLSPNIPIETAVVSYTLTDEACLAFVFRPHAKQPKIFVIPEGEKVLTEKIKRFRTGLIKFEPSFKREAKELYALLLKNLEGEIEDAKNLVIIPDGVLWELPFQTLITGDQKYLIEKYAVSYSPSLSILNRLQQPSPSGEQKQFLAFANSLPSAPLPETEKEVANIVKLYGQSEVFKRQAATEARFKAIASQFKQIHLAVHGKINSLNSFDSALLLAPTADDDGRLTVSEILEMNLSANLVVLSSCDTSNGQVMGGEGLLSLSWAFLASGVSNVVAAQWAVEEKATAGLMSNFYRILNKDGNTSAGSLRAAQLEALKLPAPANHPFYWSAFIAIGDSH